jgi:hypothetical protein
MLKILIVWLSVNIGLIAFARWMENRFKYETRFCKDVRAQLGMFAYKSTLEEKREKLTRQNKF